MRNKLLILGTFASLAATLPTLAAENSGSSVSAVPGSLRGTVICRGVQNVPVTADAEQALPMKLVARLSCGDEVAVLADSEGYTVNIRTADGKDGYVARMYLEEHPTSSSKDHRAAEAVVDNGIARWQSGAPGSDQFFSGGAVVESLTANGVTVQVSLQDTGWKLRATVAIANQGAEPVHFNPAGFSLAELKPHLRTLAYQNPKELAKALTHQVYWTAASTPNFLCDTAAQQVQSNVLQAATVSPKEKAVGVVWFERDKNADQLNLRIFVGDQIFEFPLSFPQHN
jgi:hypothetical protein